MAEAPATRIGEMVTIRNDLIEAHARDKVWLWDIGPEEPRLPETPEPPRGKKGDPRYDLAVIQYQRALKKYEAALETYERQEIEWTAWGRNEQGPVERMQWSIDAKYTLQADAKAITDKRQTRRRWYVSSRTRGKENLVNKGLPEGMSPGRGHAANVAREIAAQQEHAAALAADPVFGMEVQLQ